MVGTFWLVLAPTDYTAMIPAWGRQRDGAAYTTP